MKVNTFVTGTFLVFLATQTAIAGLGRGTAPRGVVSDAGETGGYSTEPSKPTREHVSGKNESCDNKTNGKKVALEFLKTLVPQGYENKIKVVLRNKNEAYLEMPYHIKECVDLKVVSTTVGSNVFLKLENNYDFSSCKDCSSSDSIDAKFEKCMKQHDLVSNDAVDFEKAQKKNQVSFGTKIPFNVELKDLKKSYNVVFGSAKATTYGHTYVQENLKEVPRWSCMVYETLGEKPKRLYTSSETAAAERAYKVCATENVEHMLSELTGLKESTLGNANELRSYLQGAIDEFVKVKEKAIYKEITAIEKKFKKAGSKIESEEAEDLWNEYETKLESLKEEVITPLAKNLVVLLKQREDVYKHGTKKEKKAIDNKIRDINKRINAYAKSRRNKGNDALIKALKKHNMIDEAEFAEKIRLSSETFGRVYKDSSRGRAPKIALSKANKFIEDKSTKYRNEKERKWEALSDVSDGDFSSISRSRYRTTMLQKQIDKGYQTFQQNEYKKTQEYCGMNMIGSQRNPYRCNSWRQGAQQRYNRYLGIRRNSLYQLRSEGDFYNELMSGYDLYQQNQLTLMNNDNGAWNYSMDPNNYGYDYYSLGGGSSFGGAGTFGGMGNNFSFGSPTMGQFGRQPATGGFGAPQQRYFGTPFQ